MNGKIQRLNDRVVAVVTTPVPGGGEHSARTTCIAVQERLTQQERGDKGEGTQQREREKRQAGRKGGREGGRSSQQPVVKCVFSP